MLVIFPQPKGHLSSTISTNKKYSMPKHYFYNERSHNTDNIPQPKMSTHYMNILYMDFGDYSYASFNKAPNMIMYNKRTQTPTSLYFSIENSRSFNSWSDTFSQTPMQRLNPHGRGDAMRHDVLQSPRLIAFRHMRHILHQIFHTRSFMIDDVTSLRQPFY